MAAPPIRRTPAAEAWRLAGELHARTRGHVLGVLREHDLSPPQLFALRALREDDPSPMGEIACVLGCDNSNVTGIVDRLERRGLVERRPATHDRRVKHLVITPQGIAVRAAIEAALEAGPNPLDRLDPDDQRALRDLLRKAVEADDAP